MRISNHGTTTSVANEEGNVSMKLNLLCEIHREFFTQEISKCVIDYLFNIFSTSKMADSDFHLKKIAVH